MSDQSDSPLDLLWQEYGTIFRDFDDLSLARWMAQTLGQFKGRVWRYSHPLIGAYRLAAIQGHDRQIWLKRLVSSPHGYTEATCCRAPLLPLLTRDILEAGLICQHCSGTAVEFADLPAELQTPLKQWAEEYAPVHAVAHWDDAQRKRGGYQRQFEDAAERAEKLLAQGGLEIAPKFLEHYPAVIWEDQDECLDVRPEDIEADTGNKL